MGEYLPIFESVVGNHKELGTGWHQCFCPFHEDPATSKSESFTFDPLKGSWKCHSQCGGGGIFEFVGRHRFGDQYSYDTHKGDVRQYLEDHGVSKNGAGKTKPKSEKKKGPLPERSDIQKWNDKLLNTSVVLEPILQTRFWSLAAMKKYGIGYHDSRYMIPVYERGRIVNVRRYKPGVRRGKMIGIQGRNEARCFPEQTFTESKVIFLLEGEPDTLCALSMGVPAMTFTAGAGAGKKIPKDISRFSDHTVIICYDTDEAGVKAARDVAAVLRGVTENIRIMDISTALNGTGKDVTDLRAQCGSDSEFMVKFKDAARVAAPYRPKVDNPSRVFEVSLGDAIAVRYHRKNIRITARVLGKDMQPYQIIRRAKFECHPEVRGKNEPHCTLCPLADGSSETWEAEMFAGDWLRQVRTKESDQMRAIRKMALIGCDRHMAVEDVEMINVEELILIVAVEDRVDLVASSTPVQRNVFVHSESGVGHEPNHVYTFTGTTMPQPWNQQATHVLRPGSEQVESVDAFVVDDDMIAELSEFSVEDPSLSSQDGDQRSIEDEVEDLEKGVQTPF